MIRVEFLIPTRDSSNHGHTPSMWLWLETVLVQEFGGFIAEKDNVRWCRKDKLGNLVLTDCVKYTVLGGGKIHRFLQRVCKHMHIAELVLFDGANIFFVKP